MKQAEGNALVKIGADRKKEAEKLYEAALRGAQALEKGDAAAYLKTLEERETVISRMNALDVKYSALKNAAPEDASRAEVMALESETKAFLQSVLREDEAARAKGQALLEGYREKLAKLRKSGKQVTGYTKLYQQSDGIYIDKKR